MGKVGVQTLSLVIPAYNESKRIKESLHKLQTYFKGQRNVEIILVVEKSSDKTLEFARELVGNDNRFRIVGNKVQKGKGYAVKTGMLKAKGAVVIFMDLDLSTPLTEIPKFLSYLNKHSTTDVLIGNRKHKNSKILKKQSLLRRKMGQIFNFFVQRLAVRGIKDTQCGFKAFRNHVIKPVFQRQTLDGFSFDVEVLLLAQQMGYQIDVHPVQWHNSAESKVRIVRDSLKMLMDLIRVRYLVRQTLRLSPPQRNQKAA